MTGNFRTRKTSSVSQRVAPARIEKILSSSSPRLSSTAAATAAIAEAATEELPPTILERPPSKNVDGKAVAAMKANIEKPEPVVDIFGNTSEVGINSETHLKIILHKDTAKMLRNASNALGDGEHVPVAVSWDEIVRDVVDRLKKKKWLK